MSSTFQKVEEARRLLDAYIRILADKKRHKTRIYMLSSDGSITPMDVSDALNEQENYVLCALQKNFDEAKHKFHEEGLRREIARRERERRDRAITEEFGVEPWEDRC